MTPATRVAQRFQVRQAARQVVADAPRARTASAAGVRAELTVEVLEAFGSAFRVGGRRTAGSFAGRLKQLWDLFQQAPAAWTSFKHMLGIKGDGALVLLKELPAKIKAFIAEGTSFIHTIGKKLRGLPPIAFYLDVVKASGSVNRFLGHVVDYLPDSVARVLRGIHTKAKSVAEFIDESVQKYPLALPGSVLLSAAVFAVIWINVYEVSWDVPSIIRGFLGGFTWVELLHSLPESGLGLMLSLMFPGVPTGLLFKAAVPATLALRLLWLYHKDLLEYRPGSGVRVRWEKMDGRPEGAPEAVSF